MTFTMSIVEFFPDNDGSECGYCKRKNSSFAHGMWTHTLTCQDYQDLIDRGWRRSGKYCYKPTMDVTCCPPYTIRCNVGNFKATKRQKKVKSNLIKYLKGEMDECGRGGGHEALPRVEKLDGARIKTDADDSATYKIDSETKPSNEKKVKLVKPGLGADPAKPLCPKAKERRKLKKALKSNVAEDRVAEKSETDVRPFLEFTNRDNPTHSFRIKMVRSNPPSRDFLDTFEETFALYAKYQTIVHGDCPDEITERSFRGFLCDSPLIYEEKPRFGIPDLILGSTSSSSSSSSSDSSLVGFGSFHQQYWIDGKLIAVGVVDILPSCLSSVYFYYDPAFGFLSPGVLSALQEIQFTRQLERVRPSLAYYYMGYYIHSCPKMNYKGSYSPSFLLCPRSYSWVPVEIALPKMEAAPFAILDDAPDARVEDDVRIDGVRVFHRYESMTYEHFKSIRKMEDDDDDEEVKEENTADDEIVLYAKLVGPKCATSLMLYRS